MPRIAKQVSKTRMRAFIRELPRNRNQVIPSAIKAGYSPVYAKSKGKWIMENAMKMIQEESEMAILEEKKALDESKKLMADIVGFSKEELMERLRFIATQQKDLSSALKVLAPLSKEFGVDLKPEEGQEKVTVPILNVVVDQKIDNQE